ncbi:pol protein [Gossypium australe]|uniref:Pol protein n=1 Tax=Gossypium australe TaxID=47621 RepID=A0A5B6VDS6_9ROSI|nr:pol protein [Gossypium australe]
MANTLIRRAMTDLIAMFAGLSLFDDDSLLAELKVKSTKMEPYEALYGRKYCTHLCLTELSERRVLGPELVSETENTVFLKVSLLKKVIQFDRNGKLSQRFIGSYRILKRVGPIAYQLELLN